MPSDPLGITVSRLRFAEGLEKALGRTLDVGFKEPGGDDHRESPSLSISGPQGSFYAGSPVLHVGTMGGPTTVLHRPILWLAAWRDLAGRGSIAMERGLIPWLVRG